ncbi:hypothetical protein GGX14DRAFT_669536 [Mycena pura]|uniref:Uncharacterized protein n=1 Tax=Mycena pura TaxID=153505 RepID=A0AAD6YH66_9AGAR|nr:hypothetical protein GGX14DRAFT_669536 [Mycena pura]
MSANPNPMRLPQPPAGTPTTSASTTSPDIDRKIRLYGALAALRRSRMPSNTQITDALEYIKTHSPVDEQKLSSEGCKLVGDVRDILSTTSRLIQEKNEGEILQRFVWATRGVDTTGLKATDEHKEKGNEHVEKAKRDAQEAAHHLRTLVSLVLTNAEMRKLLTDVGTVGRDLFAKGAIKAAASIGPSPEQLHHADQPAPQDHFVEQDPLSNGRPKSGTLEPSSPTSAVSDESSNSSDSEPSSPKDKKRRNFLGRLQSFHTGKKPLLDDGRAWLTDEFFPEERRERWLWRGKKVIIECQKHDDYQESVRWLLDTIYAWAARARQVSSDAKQGEGLLPAATLAQDPQLRSALALLRTLLERIADAPLEPLFEAARVMAKDAADDEELRKWWSSVGRYVRKVLLDAGYVTEPESSARARELRETGRMFYNEKYRGHFDALTDAAVGWFKSMAADPLNKALAEDFSRLTRDLLFDAEGNLQFKKKLWEDVRRVILPTLVDKIGYIPIPRVEYTDGSIDLIVENLTLSGQQLFPNIIEVEAHNFARFKTTSAGKSAAGKGKSAGDTSRHEMTLTFEQIHATMRDVAFSFRTKTGPIKMHDRGMLDVDLGGRGLSATVTLVSTPAADTSSVFRVARVRVRVGSLKLSIRDAKHGLLYKTLKPLATQLIKRQIKKALADAIRTGFEYADGQLVRVRDRVAEGKAGDGESTSGSGRRESRHVGKKDDAASTTTGTAASPITVSSGGSQFKVVASKQGSLMPDSGHPAGWVNRVAEREQQIVEKGDEWRSNAFDIDFESRPATNPKGATGSPSKKVNTSPTKGGAAGPSAKADADIAGPATGAHAAASPFAGVGARPSTQDVGASPSAQDVGASPSTQV